MALDSNLVILFSFIFSFFSHSICLNGSGCGEQIFSTVLCVRRPYPAKLEAGWWLGSLTNSWEPAVFYIWRDTWNLSSAFFFTTDYLAYSWLILCKTNINLLRVLWESLQGPTEGTEWIPLWHENWRRKPKMWCVLLFFKLFRSCVIYVVLGAPVIRYWNMI